MNSPLRLTAKLTELGICFNFEPVQQCQHAWAIEDGERWVCTKCGAPSTVCETLSQKEDHA